MYSMYLSTNTQEKQINQINVNAGLLQRSQANITRWISLCAVYSADLWAFLGVLCCVCTQWVRLHKPDLASVQLFALVLHSKPKINVHSGQNRRNNCCCWGKICWFVGVRDAKLYISKGRSDTVSMRLQLESSMMSLFAPLMILSHSHCEIRMIASTKFTGLSHIPG